MIPQQLWNPDFRFCLIRKQSKAPFEKDWANKGYQFNDTKLLEHINDGGNYGVIGGYGNLIILDKDKEELGIDIDTFCIQTGSGGKHYYILSDYDTNHVFINEMGELRAKNYQVVGAGSVHPNGNEYKIFKDVPIKFIPKEELYALIKPYLREEQPEQTKISDKKDTSRSGLEYRKVLALLRKGKSREGIYKEMAAYSKWSTSPEQYKTETFEKAETFYLNEIEPKDEVKGEVKTEPSIEIEKYKEYLKQAYYLVKGILKRYLDWTEEQYNITTLWILGTYSHDSFPTYPYLFLNAMRGSGKSRAVNLITSLSYEGRFVNSLTEATLFRTKGTLGIDEFEGLERKGKESLRELLNSAYKRGIRVIRMKKTRTPVGEEQVAEEFEVYRPIVLANISGMETVLGDRCIPLVIEKSDNKTYVNLIEIFEYEEDYLEVKKILNQCRLCRCRFSAETIQKYKKWNYYVKHTTNNNTYITNNTNNINNTNDTTNNIDKIDTDDINVLKGLNLGTLTGRELELSFPLCMIASDISDDMLKITTLTLTDIFLSKKNEDLIENTDISLIDFISQELEESDKYYQYLSDILRNFKTFIGIDEEWLNTKWLGRALKRLDLAKESRRSSRGREVRLNIVKAKEKIRMFR
jgi:hypothetical protein